MALLLKSAKDRNTDQGRFICTKTLEALALAQSTFDAAAILGKLNYAFVGIEAHGVLTDEEFAAVKRLRKIKPELN